MKQEQKIVVFSVIFWAVTETLETFHFGHLTGICGET